MSIIDLPDEFDGLEMEKLWWNISRPHSGWRRTRGEPEPDDLLIVMKECRKKYGLIDQDITKSYGFGDQYRYTSGTMFSAAISLAYRLDRSEEDIELSMNILKELKNGYKITLNCMEILSNISIKSDDREDESHSHRFFDSIFCLFYKNEGPSLLMMGYNETGSIDIRDAFIATNHFNDLALEQILHIYDLQSMLIPKLIHFLSLQYYFLYTFVTNEVHFRYIKGIGRILIAFGNVMGEGLEDIVKKIESGTDVFTFNEPEEANYLNKIIKKYCEYKL